MEPEELVELGGSLFMVGRCDEAVEAYDRAIEAEATHYEAWQQKAEALTAVGQIEEALSCYERLLEIDPRSVIAQGRREHLLRKLGRTK